MTTMPGLSRRRAGSKTGIVVDAAPTFEQFDVGLDPLHQKVGEQPQAPGSAGVGVIENPDVEFWVPEHRRIEARQSRVEVCRVARQNAHAQSFADHGKHRSHAVDPMLGARRLHALKDRFDPENVFHLNQNIPPSGS